MAKLVATIVLLSMLACAGAGDSSSDGSHQVTVADGARVTLQLRDEVPLTLIVTGIEDSRCPHDVRCIRAGEVKVTITLIGTERTVPAILCLGDCFLPSDRKVSTVTVELDALTYTVVLQDVRPYPASTGRAQMQTARFSIRVETRSP